MNILDSQNRVYIMYWQTAKMKKDNNGKELPIPVEQNSWSEQRLFIYQLAQLEQKLLKRQSVFADNTHVHCLLCDAKNISQFNYAYNNFVWEEGLMHYIKVHNIKPPSKFMRFVLDNDPITEIKLKGKYYKSGRCAYVKIKANQLLIIDALMEHGGLTKRYKEKHEERYRFSEHMGVLDVDLSGVNSIVVSGKTQRMVKYDNSIYLPEMDISQETKYIFHTHPPTPNVGGRVESGYLYEYPSVSDIEHFVYNFNRTMLQGSIVMTPEGLYNIRKNSFDKNKLGLPKDFKRKFQDVSSRVQDLAIMKYGEQFSDVEFYEKIAQDTTGIDAINQLLREYDLTVDYFPRQKNKLGNWIVGTVYIPVCSE